MGCRIKLNDFNSIKVRLEQKISEEEAIKKLFQFHKGTIRTAAGRERRNSGRNFNSIKVRLEHNSPVFEERL